MSSTSNTGAYGRSSSEESDDIPHLPAVASFVGGFNNNGEQPQDNEMTEEASSSNPSSHTCEFKPNELSELAVEDHSSSEDSDLPVSDADPASDTGESPAPASPASLGSPARAARAASPASPASPQGRRFDFVISDASDEEQFEGFGPDDDDDMGMDRFAEVIVFLESGDYFDNEGSHVQGDEMLSDDAELPDDPFERELLGMIPEPSMSLHAAAMHGNVKELKRWKHWKLGRCGRKLNRDSPLHCAARAGDVATVEYLIEQGFSVIPENRKKTSPLIIAARNGHVAVVKTLLQHGAGVDPDEMDRAFAATKSWAVVQVLAEQDPVEVYGASSEEVERTCPWVYQMLFRVVQKGRVAMLKGLLDMGANANCSSILGWTPLQIAARRGHIRCVSLLLECGANVSGRDDFKWTALHYAAREGHQDIALKLLNAGAELEAKCRTGRTPLDVATDEATRYLLENYKRCE